MEQGAAPTMPFASRIAQLESDVRAWKRITAVFAAAIAALVLTAQAQPSEDTLEAQRFVVIDDDGTQRATLGYDRDRTSLVFYDRADNERIRLSWSAEDVALAFSSAEGETVLRVDPDQIILGPLAQGGEFRLTRNGFEAYNRWSESDRPDAFASLWIPPDDLSYGPSFTLTHVERGGIDMALDQDGLDLRLSGHRVYFDDDGHVKWEPER